MVVVLYVYINKTNRERKKHERRREVVKRGSKKCQLGLVVITTKKKETSYVNRTMSKFSSLQFISSRVVVR